MRYTREQVLGRLRAEATAGRPIVGAGAGTGISAKFAEAGGADLIIIYNSGRFRMAGHGSLAGVLAYGDANAIVQEMGEREVLPVVRAAPVIIGLKASSATLTRSTAASRPPHRARSRPAGKNSRRARCSRPNACVGPRRRPAAGQRRRATGSPPTILAGLRLLACHRRRCERSRRA